MVETSPREVLLKYGRWIGATPFTKLVADQNGITVRHAVTAIRRARRSSGEDRIKRFVFPDRTVWYGLEEFGPPTSISNGAPSQAFDEETIRKALEEWRIEASCLREPVVEEVAYRVGKVPELVKPVLFKIARETGWREPDKDAKKEAEDAINLAGWLSLKEKNDLSGPMQRHAEIAINEALPAVKKRAQNIMCQCSEYIPTPVDNELRWPQKTKNKWKELFGSEPPKPVYWGAGAWFLPHKNLRFNTDSTRN